jgi:hypothetical protein
MERILELLNRGMRGRQPELPCVLRLDQDGVRLEVVEYQLPCGHVGYGVNLLFHAGPADEWVEIAALRDFNLEASIDLLTQAQRCIAHWQA